MASPFDRLMMTIRPHLPGVMDEGIRQELFMVCREFFSDSNSWQEGIDFLLTTGSSSAHIVPFAGNIVRLMYVEQDGIPVYGAYLTDGQTILLRNPSTNPRNYKAVVALTVSDPVTRDAYPIVPHELVEKYTDTLMYGILSRMMAQPSKPFTNLQLASFYERKFRGGISRAKNDANTGHTYRSQRWNYPNVAMRR